MMNDKPIVCGGELGDGRKCEACIFEAAEGDYRVAGWLCGKTKFLYLYCPDCGTRLGVTDDGQPTREARIPDESAWDLLHLASGSCPPGEYGDCLQVEECAADDSHQVAIECWRSWLSDYGPTDGQEWKRREASDADA